MEPNTRKTLDYGFFHFLPGNRLIRKKKVDLLIQSIMQRDLTPLYPIVINNLMQIIDGQHRFEACKKLKRPIYYKVIEDAGLELAQTVSSSSSGWTIGDYVHSNKEKGNQNYFILDEFVKAYSIPYLVSAQLLSGQYYGLTKSPDKRVSFEIKRGSFEVTNAKEAEAIGNYINQLHKDIGRSILRSSAFLRAFILLYSRGEKLVISLINKLGINPGPKLSYSSTVRDFVRQFEDILNFRRHGENYLSLSDLIVLGKGNGG